MIRITKVSLLLMAVALCASVAQASVSDVSVLGNGNLTVAGGNAEFYTGVDTSVAGTWIDLVADDVVIDADPTTVTGSMSKDFKLSEWWYSTPSKITASLTIEQLLSTVNPGDLASDSITATLQMINRDGTVVSSDSTGFPIANSVADGAVLGPVSTTLELSVWTPDAAGSNYSNTGKIRLIVEGTASAFTAEVCPPPADDGSGDDGSGDDGSGDDGSCDDGDTGGSTPVVPAPGAIVLASLGMGLVNWLRTRRTL